MEVIPERAVFYLEGPPAGFNFSITSVEIYPVSNSNSMVSETEKWMVSDRCLKVVYNLRVVPNLLLTYIDCIVLPAVSESKTSIMMWLCITLGHTNIYTR